MSRSILSLSVAVLFQDPRASEARPDDSQDPAKAPRPKPELMIEGPAAPPSPALLDPQAGFSKVQVDVAQDLTPSPQSLKIFQDSLKETNQLLRAMLKTQVEIKSELEERRKFESDEVRKKNSLTAVGLGMTNVGVLVFGAGIVTSIVYGSQGLKRGVAELKMSLAKAEISTLDRGITELKGEIHDAEKRGDDEQVKDLNEGLKELTDERSDAKHRLSVATQKHGAADHLHDKLLGPMVSLSITGGFLLLGGLTMLACNRLECGKKSKRPIAVQPTLSRGGAGILLQGRF